MTLDLIIPVYKNIPQLYRTLLSVGMECDPKKLSVTVVDDFSEQDEKYDDVIKFFSKFFPIRVIKSKKNGGPGIARQLGLDKTHSEYVTFVDCGDTYVTPTTLRDMMEVVEANPEIQFFSWAHNEEDSYGNIKVISAGHNRMHGKIYKREMLERYGIRFSEKSSRANEDIGFNINCRLHLRDLEEKSGKELIFQNETPMTNWKWTGPSIVRANDCAFYYQKQAMGLGICAGEAIDNAIRNGVRHQIITGEIYECMSAEFIFYLSCLNRRPEFLDEVKAGVKYFYEKYFKRIPIKDQNAEQFKDAWYNTLSCSLNDPYDPIRDKFISLDIIQWLNEVEKWVI